MTQRGTNIFSFLRLRTTDNPRCRQERSRTYNAT
nr:MAG TPA: hypothetical protein [Caudoviricetes sp.]